jgi:hypothetical protein
MDDLDHCRGQRARHGLFGNCRAESMSPATGDRDLGKVMEKIASRKHMFFRTKWAGSLSLPYCFQQRSSANMRNLRDKLHELHCPCHGVVAKGSLRCALKVPMRACLGLDFSSFDGHKGHMRIAQRAVGARRAAWLAGGRKVGKIESTCDR